MAATAIAASTLSNSSLAHEQPTGRVLSTDQRKLFAENAQAALAKCSKLQSTRALHEPAAARRTEAVEKLRQDRRQRRLDITAVLETSHKSSLIGITATTSASVLFGSTAPCIAEPEVIEGPYYVRGEYIRTDMREQQTCVSMYADVQVIDMNMCDTVKDMYVDLVYSGVVASTNGNNLISSVEAVTLYSTNKQSTKVNSRDNVFKEASGNGYDPNFQYSLVGDTVEDAVSTPTGSSATATTGDTNTALSATTFGGFAALLAAFTPMIFAIL
ncbi:Intradiol ring-cleavage dioxygenase, core [Phytophthora cactorum]|nr:Intradiol ring-cleavage dioxygenase, core [Phytophthora cactorum]